MIRIPFNIDFAVDDTARSRKAALCNVAWRASRHCDDVDSREIARSLLYRERLGSTAIGAGVAAPHAVLATRCSPLILATRLLHEVDFEAADGMPVDTLLTVIGSHGELEWFRAALLRCTRLARDRRHLGKLRSAQSTGDFAEILFRVGFPATLPRDLPRDAA